MKERFFVAEIRFERRGEATCSHRAELSILKENRFNAQKAFQYF